MVPSSYRSSTPAFRSPLKRPFSRVRRPVCTSATLFGPSGGRDNSVCLHPRNITAKFTSNVSGFDNVAITLAPLRPPTSERRRTSRSAKTSGLTRCSAPAFSFQSGTDRRCDPVGIDATNSHTLRISNINRDLDQSVTRGRRCHRSNRPRTAGLTTQQATLGAVVTRLGIDQQNNDTAAVNLEASESNIADLNVGQATTEFTKLQLLVQVGTSVLSQSNSNAQTVLTLFR